MPSTESLARYQYTESEVRRLSSDVEEWKKEHGDLSDDLWLWEDMADKAIRIYDQLIGLDEVVRRAYLKGDISDDCRLGHDIEDLLGQWCKCGYSISRNIDRLKDKYGSCAHSEEFRVRFREAIDILTPDAEFFRCDALVELRDRAIDDHRIGRTELLDGHSWK